MNFKFLGIGSVPEKVKYGFRKRVTSALELVSVSLLVKYFLGLSPTNNSSSNFCELSSFFQDLPAFLLV